MTAPRRASYEQLRLLDTLDREGCPVCHEVAGHDATYFFWFFNESYLELHTLDALTRSLGFCPGHAAMLSRSSLGAYQLAAVHRVLASRLRSALAAGRPPRRSAGGPAPALQRGPCPACRSRVETESRVTWVLAELLEDPGPRRRYGERALLCFPHLQAVAARLGRPALEHLLDIHGDATAAALATLAEAEPGGDQEAAKTVLPGLRLAVGHEQLGAGLPRVGDHDPDPPDDPVEALRAALRAGRGCPICLTVRRTWIAWFRWVAAAAARREVVDDLLPACPEHVWAVASPADTPLALATATHALRTVGARLELAARALRAATPAPRGALAARLRETLRGDRDRVRRARAGLAVAVRCPLCQRLAAARDRAIDLLFAIGASGDGRALVGAGPGLCMKHLACVLAGRPPAPLRETVVDVELGRLACLEWELEEALRKSAWECRPEPRGRESTAWRRAMAKFSGALLEEE